MNVGERIKKIRKDKNMTQVQLAKAISKSDRMVQKYESGEVVPSLDKLIEIASAFNMDIRELIEEKDNSIHISDKGEVEIQKRIHFDKVTLGALITELCHENNFNCWLSEEDQDFIMDYFKKNLYNLIQYLSQKNAKSASNIQDALVDYDLIRGLSKTVSAQREKNEK